MNEILQIISDLRALPADHEPDASDLWDAINRIEAVAKQVSEVLAMKHYEITVTALCATDSLDHDDKNVAGRYAVEAPTQDSALDLFHAAIPISVLEDFQIDCEARDNHFWVPYRV